MGKRFRFWSLRETVNEIDKDLVLCVLFLALACPNFDYAAPYTIGRITFDKPIRDATASDVFKDRAARLGCFL
ncbi:hypothetical protein GGF41_000300 [Coemansia sp. RSA 2531]|nr:hypothetical protein GGF41_000300 [Coemansia sp. RSA 2531]